MLEHERAGWYDHAACVGQTELFFARPGERPEERQLRVARARRICAGCPVVEPCRTAARTGREFGVWAGEDEEDRARAGFTPLACDRRSLYPRRPAP